MDKVQIILSTARIVVRIVVNTEECLAQETCFTQAMQVFICPQCCSDKGVKLLALPLYNAEMIKWN